MAAPPEEINLAPKSSEDEIDNDELTSLKGLTLNDAINNASGTTPKNIISSGSAHGGSSSNGTRNRSRTTSGDSFGTAAVTPAGSADTRRRITKLSKAREREKVPRLVEYFCVVSSTGGSGGDINNDTNGWSGARTSATAGSTRIVRTEPCNSNNNDAPADNSPKDNNNNTPPPPKLDGSEFQPQITARYPTQDHEENPLLSDSIIAFCFPSGKIPIITEENAAENDTNGGNQNLENCESNNGMPKVHYFVITGESGQKQQYYFA